MTASLPEHRDSLAPRPLPRRHAEPIVAEFDRETGILRVIMIGDLRVEDLETAVSTMLKHPQFCIGMNVLWDLREATVAGLSSGDLRRLHVFVLVRKDLRGGGKTAVVVAKVVDYGLIRMFEQMCDDVPTKLAVFRELTTAEAWLLADGEP